SRFYAIHVVVLPLITIGLIAAHLFFIQVQGMSPGVDDVKKTRSERFFPFFVLKDLKLWGIVFFIIAVIALCLPFEAFFDYPLFAAYDPLGSTPGGIKPEWYFYFLYYPLEMLPFWVILVVQGVILGVLVATPRIFQGTSRKALRAIGLVALAY